MLEIEALAVAYGGSPSPCKAHSRIACRYVRCTFHPKTHTDTPTPAAPVSTPARSARQSLRCTKKTRKRTGKILQSEATATKAPAATECPRSHTQHAATISSKSRM